MHVLNGVLVPSDFALPPKDILTLAVATPQLATLVVAVTAANITEALAMPNGPYTVFAPTNDAVSAAARRHGAVGGRHIARLPYHSPTTLLLLSRAQFAKIPKATLDYLLAHPDELRPILFYHLTDHRIYADEIHNYQRERTLDGREIIFIVNSTGVFINDESKIIAVNIDATNGERRDARDSAVPRRPPAPRRAALAPTPPHAPPPPLTPISQALFTLSIQF